MQNIPDVPNFPAVLVTTADHDDRVVPQESFAIAHSKLFLASVKHLFSNAMFIRIFGKKLRIYSQKSVFYHVHNMRKVHRNLFGEMK